LYVFIFVIFVNFVVAAAGCCKPLTSGGRKKKTRAPAEAEARAVRGRSVRLQPDDVT